jgi:hypothetical protein
MWTRKKSQYKLYIHYQIYHHHQQQQQQQQQSSFSQ